MIGSANGARIGITGLGVNVPARVMTNDDLAKYVDTSDEWILERTGIRERRMATEDEALTDIAMPAARDALADAGVEAAEIDQVRGPIGRGKATARVDGALAARGTLTFAVER